MSSSMNNQTRFTFTDHQSTNWFLQVQIISLDEETSEFSAKSTFDHPYPTTKIMWIPDSKGVYPDLLATSGKCIDVIIIIPASTHIELQNPYPSELGHIPPSTEMIHHIIVLKWYAHDIMSISFTIFLTSLSREQGHLPSWTMFLTSCTNITLCAL